MTTDDTLKNIECKVFGSSFIPKHSQALLIRVRPSRQHARQIKNPRRWIRIENVLRSIQRDTPYYIPILGSCDQGGKIRKDAKAGAVFLYSKLPLEKWRKSAMIVFD